MFVDSTNAQDVRPLVATELEIDGKADSGAAKTGQSRTPIRGQPRTLDVADRRTAAPVAPTVSRVLHMELQNAQISATEAALDLVLLFNQPG